MSDATKYHEADQLAAMAQRYGDGSPEYRIAVQAKALIESQAAEIAALKKALRSITRNAPGCDATGQGATCRELARAALAKKGNDDA